MKDALAYQIYEKIKNEPDLAYRSYNEIEKLLQAGNIVYETHNGDIICFILLYKLSDDFIELGAWYCDKEYRGKGIALRILKKAIEDRSKNYILFTYHDSIRDYVSKIGFKESHYKNIPLKVKLQLIRNRLGIRKVFERLFKHKKSKFSTMIKKVK